MPRAWFKHIHICMSQLGKHGKIKWFEIWQTHEIDELLKINMVTCMLTLNWNCFTCLIHILTNIKHKLPILCTLQ